MAERKRKANKDSAHQVTAGTTIRMEVPKSKRQPKQHVAAVVVQEINPVGGFVNFLRERAVVGLAVGFAIAQQAQGFIKSVIDNFINPLYALLFNAKNLSFQSTQLHFHGRVATISWGLIVTTLINFVFVLLAIYLLIRIFNLDKLDKRDEAAKK